LGFLKRYSSLVLKIMHIKQSQVFFLALEICVSNN